MTCKDQKLLVQNACIRAVSVNAKPVCAIEAVDFGRQLHKAEEISNQAIVDTHRAMPNNTGDAGARLVDNEKARLHSSMSSLEFNWSSKQRPILD